MEKVGRRHRRQGSGKETRNSRRENKSKGEHGSAPRRHAIGTGNQLADAALNSAAARFFFYFAVPGAANITDKRRAQNAGDPVLGDHAAEFVRRYPQTRESE